MIEVLVIIGILGLLAGLLLPAVQYSREAARRMRCAANLKGLALAANDFEGAVGAFPSPTMKIVFLPRNVRIGINLFSVQCLLLPYLESVEVFNMINFNLPLDFGRIERGEGQWTVASQRIASFLCPSDPQAAATMVAPNSYRACRGVEPIVGSPARPDRGVFFYANRGTRSSEITDGLSHTIMFAEKPIGSSAQGNYTPFRDWAAVGPAARGGDEWASICAGITPATPKRLDAGATWVSGGLAFSLFNATCPPNSPIPDCGSSEGHGLFSARSYHPGGVQAAMADGSVKFFTSGTNGAVWRAMATKAGGEVVQDPF